jgi:hypothetical protein
MSQSPNVTIFIDESGDLGKGGSATFTIAFLTTTDTVSLLRIIKKTRQKKLKHYKRDLPELKANSSSPEIRKYVLEQIAKCDCEINCIIVNKNKVYEYLFKNKNKLYNYVCGILVEELHTNVPKIELIIDKKDSNRMLREDFNKYIQNRIREYAPLCKTKIVHLNSYEHSGLQVVDFVAWAIQRKETMGEADYFKIIEPKIKTIKRLWQ